jgi:hypothetical protein
MSLPMKVNFDDTTENWRLWGQLVERWICKRQPRPEKVKDLVSQAKQHGIASASVPGSQERKVEIYFYDDTKELAFLFPTEAMLTAAREKIQPGPYPLPSFYDDAYNGPRADLKDKKDNWFANCRVGEYTINNCG